MTPRLFLGIDVSKDTLDLVLTDTEGRSHAKHVRNAAGGHRALVRWLGRFTADVGAVHACLEASGGYEDDAAHALHAAGLIVSVVNPRRTHAYGVVQLQRNKTDRADAALIARFCEREQPASWTPPTEEARELRQLTRSLDALKKDRDRTKNRRSRTPKGPARRAFDVVLSTYAKQIKALEKSIDTHLAAHPSLAEKRDLLVSIPGIGKLTAAVVIAELGDGSAFASARSVAAYAGLVPRHYQSGTSVRKRTKLSKAGSARLRRALYFPAMSAMRHNAAVRASSERLRNKGKVAMSVLGASMRKLLQICFGVLKNGQPFDASLHPAS